MSGYATGKHTAGYADNETHLDVLIIGAGAAGLSVAAAAAEAHAALREQRRALDGRR